MVDTSGYKIEYHWGHFMESSLGLSDAKKYQHELSLVFMILSEVSWLYFLVSIVQVVDFLAV